MRTKKETLEAPGARKKKTYTTLEHDSLLKFKMKEACLFPVEVFIGEGCWWWVLDEKGLC